MGFSDTAIQLSIGELIQFPIRQSDDGASELMTTNGSVQRVRLYGLVVSSDVLVVDDGTGSVAVRSFDSSFKIPLGSPVLVIGRPREYQGDRYVLGEIVKQIDLKWLEFARKVRPVPQKEESPNARAVSLVRKLDAGEGADYNQVLSELGPSGEEVIVHLLAVGELFETRPGRLKVLE
ncbi:hypothetical protein C4580_03770 [Candidatus Woesearchaeota archaeon]|nr:MAG: hypothetical protein C4580_03770 [Candidatus Woesearchaeota archaeon]